LNIRIPAYIIPALQTIHVFKEAGVKPPKLRIVNGQALAVEFNKMDEKKAWTNAYDTNALLHDFIAVYYPDCESFVTFSTPSYEQSTRGTYHGDLIHLVRIKQPTEQDLNNPAARKEFTPLQIALAELSLLGRNRGGAEGEDNALSYIAAHTFLFGNIQRVSPDAPNGVIKFGGTTEEKFNSIQEYLASFHPVKSMSSRLYQTNTAARGRTAEGGWAGPRPIFVTVTVGGKPVYYPAGPHEISLKSIMAGSASELTLDEMIEQYKGDADHNIKDAAGDLELLKKVAGLGYVDFLKAFMKKQTKK
ncbi:MAG: hypothetical protein Q8P56_03215, partial [Candidatus Uhrbacteria bacterium]|nr:hypothetical protein [Candidatus Uhrbacteria bacterium]